MNSRTRRSIWSNDAASELSARNEYQKKAEADCKKSHPMASKVSGVGRKPYTNCINKKMSDYDASVGAEQERKKQAEEDKRQLEIETKRTENVKTESDSTAKVLTAQAQVASIQAQTEQATEEASRKKMILIVGGSLAGIILLGVIVLAVKKSSTPTT